MPKHSWCSPETGVGIVNVTLLTPAAAAAPDPGPYEHLVPTCRQIWGSYCPSPENQDVNVSPPPPHRRIAAPLCHGMAHGSLDGFTVTQTRGAGHGRLACRGRDVRGQ